MANKHTSRKLLWPALLLSAIPALAQTIVSTIRGRVTDPQSEFPKRAQKVGLRFEF
jgi:hypothetical protein